MLLLATSLSACCSVLTFRYSTAPSQEVRLVSLLCSCDTDQTMSMPVDVGSGIKNVTLLARARVALSRQCHAVPPKPTRAIGNYEAAEALVRRQILLCAFLGGDLVAECDERQHPSVFRLHRENPNPTLDIEIFDVKTSKTSSQSQHNKTQAEATHLSGWRAPMKERRVRCARPKESCGRFREAMLCYKMSSSCRFPSTCVRWAELHDGRAVALNVHNDCR